MKDLPTDPETYKTALLFSICAKHAADCFKRARELEKSSPESACRFGRAGKAYAERARRLWRKLPREWQEKKPIPNLPVVEIAGDLNQWKKRKLN